MTKNNFVYVALIVMIGITIWFFIRKSYGVSQNAQIDKLIKVAPTLTTTPNMQNSNDEGGKWIKLDNGLQVQDTTIGFGQEAKPGDMIAANYIGTLDDGTQFDSSYDRGQPFAFVLGQGMVIKGWDIGIIGMKVGGKRKLVIPPDLGYGPNGNGSIPANATLYFDVELMAVQSQ